MPVALASMISKYTREALMSRFNTWWQTHLPALAPTAGYYSDGVRFIEQQQADYPVRRLCRLFGVSVMTQ